MSSFNTSMSSASKKVTSDYPILTMPTSKIFDLGDLQGWGKISVQVQWSGVTGASLDAVANLQQSNDRGLGFEDISGLSLNIDSVSGVQTLEQFQFSGRYLRLNVTKGSLTGGTLSISLIVKK